MTISNQITIKEFNMNQTCDKKGINPCSHECVMTLSDGSKKSVSLSAPQILAIVSNIAMNKFKPQNKKGEILTALHSIYKLKKHVKQGKMNKIQSQEQILKEIFKNKDVKIDENHEFPSLNEAKNDFYSSLENNTKFKITDLVKEDDGLKFNVERYLEKMKLGGISRIEAEQMLIRTILAFRFFNNFNDCSFSYDQGKLSYKMFQEINDLLNDFEGIEMRYDNWIHIGIVPKGFIEKILKINNWSSTTISNQITIKEFNMNQTCNQKGINIPCSHECVMTLSDGSKKAASLSAPQILAIVSNIAMNKFKPQNKKGKILTALHSIYKLKKHVKQGKKNEIQSQEQILKEIFKNKDVKIDENYEFPSLNEAKNDFYSSLENNTKFKITDLVKEDDGLKFNVKKYLEKMKLGGISRIEAEQMLIRTILAFRFFNNFNDCSFSYDQGKLSYKMFQEINDLLNDFEGIEMRYDNWIHIGIVPKGFIEKILKINNWSSKKDTSETSKIQD